MNTNLHELQADIQRLANQQQQIQTLVSGSENPRLQLPQVAALPTSLPGEQQQFYLHEQSHRRTWGQPQMHHPHIEDYSQQHVPQIPADRRVPWGDTLVTRYIILSLEFKNMFRRWPIYGGGWCHQDCTA